MFRLLYEYQNIPGAYIQGSDSVNTKSIFRTSKTEKINQFLMLMKDPEIQPFFRNYIENIIATSDLRILKRLAAVETLMGLNDYSNFENEEREITIPEQLSILAERIDNVTELVPREPIPEPVPILTSKTEIRAHLLVEHLKNEIIERHGSKFISSKEIVHFLKNEIPIDYRVGDIQNIRKVKKDVFEKARKMYPDNVLLNKKTTGRKDVRLIFRP